MQRPIGIVALVLWTAATLASASAGSLKIVGWYSGTLTCIYGPGDDPNGPSRSVQISYGAPWVYTPDPGARLPEQHRRGTASGNLRGHMRRGEGTEPGLHLLIRTACSS